MSFAWVLTVLAFACNTDFSQAAIGIKMCERNCRFMKGCTRIVYDPQLLLCTLLTDKESLPARGNLAEMKVKSVAKDPARRKLLQTCHLSDVLLLSKLKTWVCVSTQIAISGEFVDIGAMDEYKRASYLLILPRELDSDVGFKMNPKTQDTIRFRVLYKDISALLYLKTTKRLLIGLRNHIVSTSPSLGDEVIFRHHVRAKSLYANEKRNLVFFTTHVGYKKSVVRTDLRGLTVRHILFLRTTRLLIALEKKNKILYVFYDQGLAMYTSKGDRMRSFRTQMRDVDAFVYDSVNRLFYCFGDRSLFTMNLHGRTSIVGAFNIGSNVGPAPVDMIIASRCLYISWIGRKSVVTKVNLKSPSVKKTDIKEKRLSRKHGMLLVDVEG